MLPTKNYSRFALGLLALTTLQVPVVCADENKGQFQLAPIVVTAQKTAEDKQDVPASISVLDSQTLQDLNITTTEELALIIPSVDFLRADNRTTYLVYRGIGGTTTMSKSYNINMDGVTLPYVAPNIGLDTERIEVIRGSQGALYGRNTLGGLVTVTTREPSGVTNGFFKTSYENPNTYQVQGAIGGELTDTIGARLALSYNNSDGYFENTYLDTDDGNKNKQFSLNGKIQLSESSAGKITLSLIADQFDGGFDNYATGGGHDTRNNESGYNDGYLIAPILRIDKDFGSLSFSSISNYSRSNYATLQDWDFSEFDVQTGEFKEDINSYSQEFRLHGENGTTLKWLAGAYLLYEDNDSETEVAMGSDAFFGPGNDFRGVVMGQKSTVTTGNAALFGQMTYSFLEQFEATGRLRLDYEEKDLEWLGSNNFSTSNQEKTFSENWFAVLPSASLSWVPNADHRTYFSISQGYKTGDYNNVQVESPVVTEAVAPEYSLTYELGYKGLLLEKRLEFNIAAFYIDWTDMQVDTPVTSNGQLVYVKQNAAEAHSTGIELQARAQLTKGWEMFLGGNYLFEYEFDKFPNSPAGNLAGSNLPQTSEYSISLGTIYRHSNGLFVSIDATLFGPKFFDEANQFKQGDYTLVNTKIGYEAEAWSIYLYGRNLLDEEYSASMFAEAELAGEPLLAGVQAEFKF